MLAYERALLSEHERYAYVNNIAVNFTGGVRKCIPNDHMVEISVHQVKHAMRAVGSNVAYKAARTSARCLDVMEEMASNLAKQKSGKHAVPKTERDIAAMAKCLTDKKILCHIPLREHPTFPNFSADLLQDVRLVGFNLWISKQKDRAHLEM